MISSVTPVYNAATTLRRAVESLLLQSEIDEIILVEDGSTDNSFRLCQELAESHPIIKVIQHPGGENKGAPSSRNLGLALAKNEWIQFMDADDELLPGKLANQTGEIVPEVGLIIGKFLYVNVDESVAEIFPLKDVWSGLLVTRLGNTTANLWRKSAVLSAGAWDVNLINIQEYNLIFSMLKNGSKVKISNQALTKIYFQANSITNSSTREKEKRDNYFVFRAEIKSYLQKKNLFTLSRRHYFNRSTGLMLRYHRPDFRVEFDETYFMLFSGLRALIHQSKQIKYSISGFILPLLRSF